MNLLLPPQTAVHELKYFKYLNNCINIQAFSVSIYLSEFLKRKFAGEKEVEEALTKIMEERQQLRVREEEIKLREQALKEKESIENELKKLRNKEIRASQVRLK